MTSQSCERKQLTCPCSMLSAEVLAVDTDDVLATTTDNPDSTMTAAGMEEASCGLCSVSEGK